MGRCKGQGLLGDKGPVGTNRPQSRKEKKVNMDLTEFLEKSVEMAEEKGRIEAQFAAIARLVELHIQRERYVDDTIKAIATIIGIKNTDEKETEDDE